MNMASPTGVLVNETFNHTKGTLPAGWLADGNAWRVTDGQLRVDAMRGEARILVGKPDWQNYEITTTATFEKVADDARWLSVVFRSGKSGTLPWSQFCVRFNGDQRNGAEFAVRVSPKSWRIRGSAKVARKWQIDQPQQLRVVVRGSDVEAFIDGQRVIESPFCLDRETGCVGLAANGCIARFDDFRVRRLPPTTPLSKMRLKRCEVVAHRGFSAVAPENTLSAIAQAIRAGATGSECDVRRSKDGRIIAMHDETVNRTTNGKGKVEDLTFAQLRKLDAGSWKHKKFAGERIPTLDEILAAHKDTGCTAVVEIKVKDIEDQVIDAIRRAGMMNQTAVIAFDGDVVREMRTREPRLPCAWLCGKSLKGTPAERADWIAKQAKEYKTNMVDLGYSMLSRDVIAELHQRGLVVWAWTVDDPVVIDALMRWGVDSITTDCPDLIVRAMDKMPKHSRRRHR
ncbi:MAG: hypothetical protein JW888_04590 [Pirellulales bacterium]|nr:hypothetical protein [Pirellulales bacterium]